MHINKSENFSFYQRTIELTLNAGLAPSSKRHLTAGRHRLEAAMCRAVPKAKSLQVASTSIKKSIRRHLYCAFSYFVGLLSFFWHCGPILISKLLQIKTQINHFWPPCRLTPQTDRTPPCSKAFLVSTCVCTDYCDSFAGLDKCQGVIKAAWSYGLLLDSRVCTVGDPQETLSTLLGQCSSIAAF